MGLHVGEIHVRVAPLNYLVNIYHQMNTGQVYTDIMLLKKLSLSKQKIWFKLKRSRLKPEQCFPQDTQCRQDKLGGTTACFCQCLFKSTVWFRTRWDDWSHFCICILMRWPSLAVREKCLFASRGSSSCSDHKVCFYLNPLLQMLNSSLSITAHSNLMLIVT